MPARLDHWPARRDVYFEAEDVGAVVMANQVDQAAGRQHVAEVKIGYGTAATRTVGM